MKYKIIVSCGFTTLENGHDRKGLYEHSRLVSIENSQDGKRISGHDKVFSVAL
ncbi:MAG: hypothetical protein ACI92E_001021, partial [Oceanicoccus sp.]